jgi:hypothetical protein
MKDLEFLDKQIMFLEESIRIQELMSNKTNKFLIREGAIAGMTDDALRASIKTGIKDAIRDTIDDVIKNASKETAEDLLKGNVKKVLGDGFVTKNYAKIQSAVETKLGQKLAPQEKLAITTELKNMKLNGQLDDIYKKTGQEVTQTYSQRLSKVAQGSADNTVTAAGKNLDKSGQKVLDFVKRNATKSKTWWKGKFQKWGWVDGAGKLTSKGRKRMALILGAAAVTWWMMSGNDDEKIPNPKPDNTDGGSGGGDTGGGTGGTTYTNCTDFPYKKGCQNSVIAEVQQCLGLTADGKFGPNTEKTLKDKGYGAEITKEVYDKIKANCGGSSTTTTTTLNPADNYTLVDVDAENASSLFK